jgi:hypothetical protein
LPHGEKERRRALYEHFLGVDESFPEELLDALHCILQLSDKQGLQCLRERADLVGVQLVPHEEVQGEHGGRHLHPQHVALRAYLDHREIFDQAIDFRAFIQPSSPAEFNGAREGVDCRHDDPNACEAFRQAVSAYFSERYLGRYCEVRWYPEEDEVNILILHGRQMVVTPVEERGEERVLRFRELRQDTIRYTPATGRLRTSAEHATEREELKKLFAEHLIGEADFFDGEDSQNLYTNLTFGVHAMQHVFEPRGYFTVPDGTDVSPFLNATDVNQRDVPWGALGEMSIASGRIKPGVNSWVHIFPAVTQVTYLLSVVSRSG